MKRPGGNATRVGSAHGAEGHLRYETGTPYFEVPGTHLHIPMHVHPGPTTSVPCNEAKQHRQKNKKNARAVAQGRPLPTAGFLA